LAERELTLFRRRSVREDLAAHDAVADLQFVDNSFDPQGLAELSACTLAVMSGHPHAHEH